MTAVAGRGKSVAVIGAGGNIGSHLAPHLVRIPGVGRATLVDRDCYDETNLWTQDIRRRDLTRPKAVVQARRMREIDPTFEVEALATAVEDLPLGALRADVLLSCVDSRAARRSINALAWKLGVPWIDAGVNGDELLCRVNVYVPGPGRPCLECAWSDVDYEMQEQPYPCTGTATVAPTNAPSALGALAASLQALECRKLLAGDWDHVAVGRQVTVSALTHRALVTRFTANPRCRFDHLVLEVREVANGAAAYDLPRFLEFARRVLGSGDPLALKVVDQRFVRRLTCIACGASRSIVPYLLGRLDAPGRTCTACGGALLAAGFDQIEWLRPEDLSPDMRTLPLASLGLRREDVVSVASASRVAHFELGGTP